MSLLALIRHGATDWNAERRLQGRVDRSLSAAGQASVRGWRLPALLAEAAWASSPLGRARETAALLGRGDCPVEERLIEMDWGDWEGLRLPELRDRYGAEFAHNEAAGLDFRPSRGESPREVRARVMRWLAATAAEHGSIAVVTHKGVLRAVLSAATGWDMTAKAPLRLNGAALHRFEVDPDGKIGVLEPNIPLVPPR